MSRRAIVVCDNCNEELEGDIPDSKRNGAKHTLDGRLADDIAIHHIRTRKEEGRLHGHDVYSVYADNRPVGVIEADSYGVYLREETLTRGPEGEYRRGERW